MLFVVSFVDQRFPVALLEVSVTLPPGQNVSGPLAVTTGCGIEEVALTVIEEEVADAPAFVIFTAYAPLDVAE